MTLTRIGGVPIELHSTFVWLVGAWVAYGGWTDGWLGLVGAVVGVVVAFGSVLVHELGHVAVAAWFGIRCASIVLLPIGGAARLHMADAPPWVDLWVSLAGPVASVLLGVAVFGLWAVTGWWPLWWVGVLNVALGVFNLVPAFPFDGGRIFRATLVTVWGDPVGTRVALTVGALFAVAFAVLGVVAWQPLMVVMAAFMALMQWRELRVLAWRQRRLDLVG